MKRVVFLSTILLTISTCVFAQNFEVAPIRLNFHNDAGETETRIITVKNHGNSRENITMTMRDYVVHRRGNRETLPSGSTQNSISDWVTLNPSFLELQPNEEQEVEVTFQAPVDDDHPAKWGILSFATAAERTAYAADDEVQTGIFISGRVDTRLMYNPPIDQDPNMVISNLREVTNEEDEERVFAVDIDNLGYTIARSELFLIASSLQTADETRFPDRNITAYPQSSREIRLTLPDELEPGSYSLAAILDYGSRTNLKGTQITIEVE